MHQKPTYEELERRVRDLERAESERKKKTEATQTTSELLSFFIKHSPIYAFLKLVSRQDSKVLYASDNYIDMIGLPAHQMVGKTMHELFPHEFAEKITRDDIDVIRKGKNLKLEEELNGRNYITYKFPLMQGGNKYLAGYTVDITELKRTEEELAQIFNMSLDMICIADINTATFIRVNPAFTEILGHSEEALLKKSFLEFVHPEDIEATRAVIEQKLRPGTKVINFENRYRCKNGSYLWLSWVSHPNIEKGITYAVARDITKWKENEKALKKSKEILDATGRMARVGGWEIDAKTMAVVWTDETYRIHEVPLDYKPSLQEAINFFHPKDREGLSRAIQQALEHGEPYDMEIRFITAMGKRLWTRTICKPEIVDGKTVKLKGTFQDITERKQTEDALRESETRLRTIFDVSQTGIILVDFNGIVTYANQGMAKMFRCTQQELIGTPYTDHVHPEHRKIGNWQMRKLIAGEIDSVAHERHYIRADGTDFYGFLSGKRHEDDQGKLISLIGVIADITENKILENKLLQSQKMEALGNLAGGIAHDFNNLLASMIGFTEVALDEIDRGAKPEDSLQEVLRAGKRARDLVRQILLFSRQSDKEVKPIQPDMIAKEVLKFIRSSIPTTIKIEQQIECDSLIMGNPTHVHQMFMNLCTNAAQAMENKGGKLAVRMQDVAVEDTDAASRLGLKAGNYLEIMVADSGPGIPAGIIDSIFDPYFTTKDPGEGTGMGLSVVKGIVESCGGKITVDSRLGHGSTFTIYLPISKNKRAASQEKEAEKLPRGSERILFVDDEASIARLGKRLLEGLGYSVTTQTSSVKALELFRAKPGEFDIVLTDMTMPNMAGDNLAVEMMKTRPDVPVILCTGYSRKISDELAKEIGIKTLLYKPIVKADLAKTVRKVLDETKGGAEARSVVDDE